MDYQHVVEELKNRVDVVKFIGQYTQLKKSGRIYQGICVLHPDSETPSLTVYPETQSYYCFGCKSGGSIIEFVKAHYNYDFYEAINYLAEVAGMDLQLEDSPQAKARRSKIENNMRAVLNTQNQLRQAEKAREYLHRRGFSDATIDAFNLGFDSGENSIVIPINNGFGKPVGFSRRFLDPGKGPKYKNSRNDEVFNKGEILYNLDKARKHLGESLLVLEGYFDVLSAWQSGFYNAVAICKDTLTEEQAALIAKLCKGKTVILVPDNDDTGRASVLKNRELLLASDPALHIRVAVPGDACKDLNDVLLAKGEEGVRETIANSLPAELYVVRYMLDQEPVRERQYVAIRDFIKTIDNILVLEDIVKELTRHWDKPEGIIRSHLELGAGKASFWFPHDRVLERKLLSCIIAKPDILDLIADRVVPECFYVFEHRLLYDAMLHVYREKGAVSQTDLYLELKRGKRLENVEETFNSLDIKMPAADLEVNALRDGLLSLYYQRKLLQAALEIAESVSANKGGDFERLQARAQDLIFSATDMSISKPVHSIDELLTNRWEEYLKRAQGLASRGLMTGFYSVDNLIKGFKNKHLIVMAAATSTGKTAMALNIVRNVLKREPPVPVGVISLEMSAEEIMDRLIISELGIDGQRYDQGALQDNELEQLNRGLNMLYKKPLLISDERGLTVAQIRARLRRIKAQLGSLGLVVVDYLQTIQLEMASNITTARATGDVVLQLRNLAAELDVPILLLSQINRNYSHRQDKRPQLSDLRESGNIEEFADMVLFLYRHARLSAAAYEEAKSKGTDKDVEVIVAKNRTGRTGITTLKFDEQYMRFSDPHSDSLEASAPAGPTPFDD